MPVASSLEEPLPVRTVARLIGDWVGRLGRVWVEGQVTDVNRRPGMSTVFLTLRDPVAEVSLRATCARALADGLEPPLADGSRIVAAARPDFWLARGSLTLNLLEIRPVGVGELLARIERLKAVLAAEGLFAAERKRRPPFLPGAVGLVTGRASAAARDVMETARRRWPAVRFVVREVAVQGPLAVPAVVSALGELAADPAVEVIVIARGGGSVEDLLPFSDEALLRAVAGCRRPVIAAIGHEQDSPLLDLVADVRASTPTDAGKRLVPDVAEEVAAIARARRAARGALTGRLDRERTALAALTSRPCLARPLLAVEQRTEGVAALRARADRCVRARLDGAATDLSHARARVRALSPAATLARGYAVLRRLDGRVVRSPGEVTGGERVSARLAEGELGLVVEPAGSPS